MIAPNHFSVGLLRGLNSVAGVFALHPVDRNQSLIERLRSDWNKLGEDLRRVLGNALLNDSHEIAKQGPAHNHKRNRQITEIIAARWSDPLPPPGELEKFDRIITGGAERLLRMAEVELTHRFNNAKRDQYLG